MEGRVSEGRHGFQSRGQVHSSRRRTFPPWASGRALPKACGRSLGPFGAGPLPASPESCGIGAEICRGALIVGRPLRFGPLRNEILLRSSDMVWAVLGELRHQEVYTSAGPYLCCHLVVNKPTRFIRAIWQYCGVLRTPYEVPSFEFSSYIRPAEV